MFPNNYNHVYLLLIPIINETKLLQFKMVNFIRKRLVSCCSTASRKYNHLIAIACHEFSLILDDRPLLMFIKLFRINYRTTKIVRDGGQNNSQMLTKK